LIQATINEEDPEPSLDDLLDQLLSDKAYKMCTTTNHKKGKIWLPSTNFQALLKKAYELKLGKDESNTLWAGINFDEIFNDKKKLYHRK
jgi:hypothetical protein